MTTCQHCDTETSNGLGLCDLSRRFVTEALGFLPTYYANLARWRPGRAGSRPVPGSRVLYDGHDDGQGTGDRISDQLDVTAQQLRGIAVKLATARPYLRRLLTRLDAAHQAGRVDDVQYVAWLCRGFVRFLPALSTLDWAGQFVADVADHERTLRHFTEEYVPGWYAGACRRPVAFDDDGAVIRCGAGTYAVPGLTWVTCPACGDTTAARDHLEVIRTEAAGWVAPPKRLAEAIVALIDTEQSVPNLYDRIRQWATRERIVPVVQMARGYVWDEATGKMVVGDVQVGRARYRLGDVLEVLYNDSTTRRTRKRDRVS